MKSEPVITGGAIVGLIMAFLTMAISLGWIKLDQSQMGTIEAFLAAAVALVIPLAAAFFVRKQVTPVAAPKTKDGEPAVLIPQSQVTPAMMAAIGQEPKS